MNDPIRLAGDVYRLCRIHRYVIADHDGMWIGYCNNRRDASNKYFNLYDANPDSDMLVIGINEAKVQVTSREAGYIPQRMLKQIRLLTPKLITQDEANKPFSDSEEFARLCEATGMTTGPLAKRLGISIWTLTAYRRSIQSDGWRAVPDKVMKKVRRIAEKADV